MPEVSYAHSDRAPSFIAKRILSSLGPAFAILLAVASQPMSAPAATYYVRQSGNDSNEGTTPDSAFVSLRHAARRLMAPGDTLIVGPGVYAEGNVEPLGSGNRDLPIVIQADVTGELTGDPAAPVVLRPPNTPDATTGFIVYGKHDIVIDGFTIEGAQDAGIQVRPHSETGVDASRVTLLGNTVQGSDLRGIEVIAAGDVTVVGNRVSDNRIAGIAVHGGNSLPIRPYVAANHISRNSSVGIAVTEARGGSIERNEIENNGSGIGISTSSDLRISDNSIRHNVDRSIVAEYDCSDLGFEANDIDTGQRSSIIAASGSVSLVANRIAGDSGFSLVVISARNGVVEFTDNDAGGIHVQGAGAVSLQLNRFLSFAMGYSGSLQASDNTVNLMDLDIVGGTGIAEIRDNRLGSLLIEAPDVVVADNEIAGDLTTYARRSLHVEANEIGESLVATRYDGEDPQGELDPVRIVRNTVGSYAFVRSERRSERPSEVPLEFVDNRVGGAAALRVHDSVHAHRNQASELSILAATSTSLASVIDNRLHGGSSHGISIQSRGEAVIADNQVSDCRGVGIEVDRSPNVRITGNQVRGAKSHGIRIRSRTPRIGDCNGDHEVTVEELVQAVHAALTGSGSCTAVGPDLDTVVSVDVILRMVTVSLRGFDHLSEPQGSFVVSSNRVTDSRGTGVDARSDGAIALTDNLVLRSGAAGIFARTGDPRAELRVTGSTVGGSAIEGILAAGSGQTLVESNRVFSNGLEGIMVRDAPAAVVINNLVYDNRSHGIAFGRGSTVSMPEGTVMNNTIHANARWGLTIGSAEGSAPGTSVLNNIVAGNLQGGIAAELGSFPGLWIAFNLNNDGYSDGVEGHVTNFEADPRWVDPAGVDGILGGDGFGDDDFHLSNEDQRRSPAIDAGSGRASSLLIRGSAVRGMTADAGIVDLGFHYIAEAGPVEPTSP